MHALRRGAGVVAARITIAVNDSFAPLPCGAHTIVWAGDCQRCAEDLHPDRGTMNGSVIALPRSAQRPGEAGKYSGNAGTENLLRVVSGISRSVR